MIEAVNSAISSAQLAKGSLDALSAARSFAGDAQAVQAVARAPVAPYISPYVSFDTRYKEAVIQLRDSETGDVVNQFPTEPTLRARQASAKAAQLQSLQPQSPEATETPRPVAGEGRLFAAQSVTTVQEAGTSAPSSQGAGVAQAAIAALSIGAQAGQVTPTTVQVTA
jgi:hypothetical protein